MTTNLGAVEVCQDCYMAHHYGAHSHTRQPTDNEYLSWLHSTWNSHHARDIMGLEFTGHANGLIVTEWFASEDDQRCEGGEPLAELPEHGHESHGQHVTAITDWTCSNHEVEELYDTEGDRTGETSECPHCGQRGWENGLTEFTWTACDGCNSHLGGARYRLAIHWETLNA